MAVEMMTWARRQVFPAFDLNGSERFVLFLLADNASWNDEIEQWYAHPHLKTLVRDSGLSQSTVQRALNRFSDLGLVSRQRRYKKSGAAAGNGYTLHPEAVETPIAQTSSTPGNARVVTTTTPENSGVVTMTTPGNMGELGSVDNPSEPQEFKSGRGDHSRAGMVTTTTSGGHHDHSRARYSSGRTSLTTNEPSSSSMGSSVSNEDSKLAPAGAGKTTKTSMDQGDASGTTNRVQFGMYQPSNATNTVNLDRIAATVARWGVNPDRDRLVWLADAICERSARTVHSPGSFVRTSLSGHSGAEWATVMVSEFGDHDVPKHGGQELGSRSQSGVRREQCPVPGHALSGYLRSNCPECRIHHSWPDDLDRGIYEQMTAEIRALVDADPAVTVTDPADNAGQDDRPIGPVSDQTGDRSSHQASVAGIGHRRAG